MNLAIFFDPVPETVLNAKTDLNSWQSNIKIFHESFPDWSGDDIAIIGLTESRGSHNNKGVDKGANATREVLYKYKRGTGNYKISDLGNLRNGENLEATYLRLKEVCETLMNHNVIPIIIGGSQDATIGQFLAYENGDKPITLLNIDSKIDLIENVDKSASFLRDILTHDPNFLFHYSHLGYQSFLVEKEQLEGLEKLHFELYRLGQVRDNLEESEPVIRMADMISFDVNAIKMSDAPGNAHANAFGLSGEEACQLSWYAGINSRVSSFGIYEFNPELDSRNQTASVVATMVWYFTEGFYHRNKETGLHDPRYTKYIVSFKEEPHKMVFYKDTITEKWWMEVPIPEDKTRYSRNALVPCSYKDYQDASNGEIPNRWILTHAKLS